MPNRRPSCQCHWSLPYTITLPAYLWPPTCEHLRIRIFGTWTKRANLQENPWTVHKLVGGWTTKLRKYARQIGSFPQVRVKIKHIWSKHLVKHHMTTNWIIQITTIVTFLQEINITTTSNRQKYEKTFSFVYGIFSVLNWVYPKNLLVPQQPTIGCLLSVSMYPLITIHQLLPSDLWSPLVGGRLPSLKLTYSLKIDGWKIQFPFGIAYFQGIC